MTPAPESVEADMEAAENHVKRQLESHNSYCLCAACNLARAFLHLRAENDKLKVEAQADSEQMVSMSKLLDKQSAEVEALRADLGRSREQTAIMYDDFCTQLDRAEAFEARNAALVKHVRHSHWCRHPKNDCNCGLGKLVPWAEYRKIIDEDGQRAVAALLDSEKEKLEESGINIISSRYPMTAETDATKVAVKECPRCQKRVRVKKDGTLAAHKRWLSGGHTNPWTPCDGIDQRTVEKEGLNG